VYSGHYPRIFVAPKNAQNAETKHQPGAVPILLLAILASTTGAYSSLGVLQGLNPQRQLLKASVYHSATSAVLVPPGIADQGDLDPYISNPGLHHPTKKTFCGDQASLDTTTLLSAASASLALAPLGKSLIVSTVWDGQAKNTSRGDITKDPNDDKYSSLPLSLVPSFIGNQGDLDAYISNPALHQPTKKAFRGSQASLVTTVLLTSTSASPARISIYTNKRSALASLVKGGVTISRNVEYAPQRSLKAPLKQVIKDRESTNFARKIAFNRSLESPSGNQGRILEVTYGSSW
jgi:hypothetical protein